MHDSIFHRFIIQVLLAWFLGIAAIVYAFWRKLITFFKRISDGEVRSRRNTRNEKMFGKHTGE
jgi:hypothetical protein